ncbi:MAG: winged helix-turn-helix transcriptional regulator [Nitrososphaerota archaeon]|nr:winged helix-turn-helix transcriptional regulator [Nitrososphaerota archaeon]
MATSPPAVVTFVQGSSVRSKLLQRLAFSPHTPTELATMESKHISHVSRALVELKDWGLVAASPSGSREHYYKITTQGYAIAAAISMRTAK